MIIPWSIAGQIPKPGTLLDKHNSGDIKNAVPLNENTLALFTE